MARRRMLSENMILDEEFNALSINAQCVFVRLLIVSDDFGFVPANAYTLVRLINCPTKINLQSCVDEIVAQKLCFIFDYQEKKYLCFKRERFDEYQSYLTAKRTRSEYLKLSKEEITSKNFQEILRNYSDVGSTSIESIKYKDKSTEYKDESIKYKEEEKIFLRWNEFAGLNGLAQVKATTDKRLAKVAKRLSEPMWDFEKILTHISTSDFLLGKSSKWKVTFDFIIENENNYLKILEGNYNGTGTTPSGKYTGTDTAKYQRLLDAHNGKGENRFTV